MVRKNLMAVVAVLLGGSIGALTLFIATSTTANTTKLEPENGRCWAEDEVEFFNYYLTSYMNLFGVIEFTDEHKNNLCSRESNFVTEAGKYNTCDGRNVHQVINEIKNRHGFYCADGQLARPSKPAAPKPITPKPAAPSAERDLNTCIKQTYERVLGEPSNCYPDPGGGQTCYGSTGGYKEYTITNSCGVGVWITQSCPYSWLENYLEPGETYKGRCEFYSKSARKTK